MRMTKVRALCLSGALFTVLPCAQGSEKDELALVMKQLDQLQASLERAKVVAVQEHTSHRFYFDYPQATDDIAKIKRGISTYLEPSRAQPVLPQDISGQYQREGAMTHEQEQAFRASTNNADPNLLNLLFIGTLVAVLFLWAAFAFVTVYRGWEAGNVSEKTVLSFVIRVVVLLVVSLFLFAS